MVDTGRLPDESWMDPRPFVRGVREVRPDGHCPRLGAENAYRLPADTWDCARVPAGVRLELESEADYLQVSYTAEEPHLSAASTMSAAFSVWTDEQRVHQITASPGAHVAALPLGGGTWIRFTIYLPEMLLPQLHGLQPINGEIRPVPTEKTWCAYGDSITQGWSATDPGRAYPALIARRRGLDVHNLGFAAAARGEIPVAEEIADTRPDYVTLAFGTNNWPRLPTGRRHMAEILRDFVTVIRTGAPHALIVVLSPLLREEAEHTPNRAGATLADLRAALEEMVGQLQQQDAHLRLVPGLQLVAAEHLEEGIHPTDRGHEAIAQALEAAMFEDASGPGSAAQVDSSEERSESVDIEQPEWQSVTSEGRRNRLREL